MIKSQDVLIKLRKCGIYSLSFRSDMSSTPTTDQQLVQLGFEVLENLFRPVANEAAKGFFVDPEAHEVEPTQES